MSSIPPGYARFDVPTWIVRAVLGGALVLARSQYSEIKDQLDTLRLQYVELKLKQEELQRRFDDLDRRLKLTGP